MSLKETLDSILEKKAESRVEPLDCDPRIRAGVEGAVRNAKEAIPALEREYKAEVLKTAVIIAVCGKGAAKFAQISKDVFKTVAIDFHYVVDEVAAAISARGGNDEYNTQEHWLLLNELQRVRHDYEIASILPPEVNYQTDNVYHQS